MTGAKDGTRRTLTPWLILLIWSTVMALSFLWIRPLWQPDDGRYAEVAREMVVSRDWITPTLNFVPHYSKPPLTYWVSAIGISVFGRNEFGARMAVALPFVACVLLTYLLGTEFRDRKTGFLAGLILLTSPIPFIGANIITTDMLLTCCELGAVYFFWRWYGRNPKPIGSLFLGYVFLGLAFLTKGPVGLLIPFLAFLGYAAYFREWRILKVFASLRGWVVCLIIGLTWYVVLVIRHPELVDYFLGHELADRMFTTVHHRNNSFIIYPAVLLGGLLPWTVYFVKSWGKAFPWRELRNRLADRHRLFLLSWILLPLIFFSLVESRLPLYVLPLFVPMSILTADYLAKFADSAKAGGNAIRIAVYTTVVLLGLQVGSAYFPSQQNLYPLVKSMKSAGLENAVVYANRNDLYSICFYMNRGLTPTNNYGKFLSDSLPAFYILDRGGPEESLPEELRKQPVLAHHFNYWLFCNRPIQSNSSM